MSDDVAARGRAIRQDMFGRALDVLGYGADHTEAVKLWATREEN